METKTCCTFALAKRIRAGKTATNACHFFVGDPLAQLVEQYTFNVWVLGSSPKRITLKIVYSIIKEKFFKNFSFSVFLLTIWEELSRKGIRKEEFSRSNAFPRATHLQRGAIAAESIHRKAPSQRRTLDFILPFLAMA